MKNKLFIRNPIYLIISTIVISLVLSLLLYGTVKLEQKIEDKMLEVSTADVLSIVNNSVDSIKKLLKNENYIKDIQTNKELHSKIENNLELLITPNIKYSYLIYKDEKGVFRFLADGASINEKAFMNQKFDIESSKWLEIFIIKKPLTVEHKYLHELSISYLFPILNSENEVELILVIDFSVQKVKEINKIISLIKSGIFSIIIIVIIFLLILLIQTFKYIAIKRTAYIDKLTNVYNRNYLQESEDFINLSDYVLATLDIDHFKTVNDTFGHDVGDKILKDVAHIILMTSRTKDDIIIRYGGEEFVILSKIKRDDVLSALNVIERIYKNIQEHKFYYTKNEYMEITVSIGVNLVPGKSRTFSDAFKLADIALYNAKNRGRNNIQIYDDVDSQLDTTMMSINDIKDAIEDDRITCFYQKIVDNKTNEVCHYEALLRIIDNKGNVISPDKILPTIKGTFILRNITKKVLDICYKKLLSDKEIKINVNLNPKDIMNESIIDILKNYSLEEGISNRLGIEIVETEDLISSDLSKNNLLMLKDLGYKIFIDDFGSGYSNFIYLAQIKTDYIKIDGSIILNILEDKISFLLVKSIVDFAKESNIKVIAEYVCTKEIYEKVKSLEIEYSQGTYISIPKENIE